MANNLRGSFAARLALVYGLILAVSITVVSGVFYVGTIGVLDGNIDNKILSVADRLYQLGQAHATPGLVREINRQMSDGLDSDSEIFLFLAPDGTALAGNIGTGVIRSLPLNALVTRLIDHEGKKVQARVIVRQFADGERLLVGRDLAEREAIEDLVWRALGMGAALSMVLVSAGAVLFRRKIEWRIGRIRRTAKQIEAGDLSRRIPVTGEDEFSLLNRDINRMLDRIEHLMDGVRHVSNAIAHDLRTPLGRIRSKLEASLQRIVTDDALAATARDAIADIDDLILVFEKLLQIAEAESGMRTQTLEIVDLGRIAGDIADLYDATAEEQRITLKLSLEQGVEVLGDRNLLGSALASLVDNAIKYAGTGATIELRAFSSAEGAVVEVRDNGPGIAAEEMPKVTQRFYRLDHSRHLPGNGLGLSIVSAIASLHNGTLQLESAQPGLVARIVLASAA